MVLSGFCLFIWVENRVATSGEAAVCLWHYHHSDREEHIFRSSVCSVELGPHKAGASDSEK